MYPKIVKISLPGILQESLVQIKFNLLVKKQDNKEYLARIQFLSSFELS